MEKGFAFNLWIWFLFQTLLRELEFKKPQLDELVNTAESLKTDANKLQLQTKGEVHVSIPLFMFFVIGRLEDLGRPQLHN